MRLILRLSQHEPKNFRTLIFRWLPAWKIDLRVHDSQLQEPILCRYRVTPIFTSGIHDK